MKRAEWQTIKLYRKEISLEDKKIFIFQLDTFKCPFLAFEDIYIFIS